MSDGAHCFKHQVMKRRREKRHIIMEEFSSARIHAERDICRGDDALCEVCRKKARSGDPNYRSMHGVCTKQAQGMAPLLARHRSLDRLIRQPLVDVYGVDANMSLFQHKSNKGIRIRSSCHLRYSIVGALPTLLSKHMWLHSNYS